MSHTPSSSTSPPLPQPGASATIAVCGVQGAGKSVFLTCVFKTLASVLPTRSGLRFDRKEFGGARYFETVEAEIRAHGQSPPTRERIRTRLYLPVDDRASKLYGQDLPIDLVDFGGKYFELFSDLTGFDEQALPAKDQQEAREISDLLEHCDGLIILVSTTNFQPTPGRPREDAFPSSVTYLLEDCRHKRRPVALVFSKADKNPELTRERIEQFGNVQRFRQQFTADLNEALRGEKPFGIVELLSCYDEHPDGLPKAQNPDGSIWKLDASRTFLRILQAAWPKILARATSQPAVGTPAPAKSPRPSQGRRSSVGKLAAAAVVLGLLAAGAYVAQREPGNNSEPVLPPFDVTSTLRDEGLEAIKANDVTGLREALAQLAAQPASDASAAALAQLWATLRESVEGVLATPSLDPAHLRQLESVGRFEPLLTESGPEWWTPQLAETLAARAEFLAGWPSRDTRAPEQRLAFLNQHLARARSLGDEPFARLLAEHGRPERLAVTRIAAPNLISKLLSADLNPATQQTLERLFPGLAFSSPGPLRLSRFEQAIDRLDSAEALQAFYGRFTREIGALEASARRSQTQTASELSSLLEPLPPLERVEIWRIVINALAAGYLFDRGEATGVSPLPQKLGEQLAGGTLSSTALTEQTIYAGELTALRNRIASRLGCRQSLAIFGALRAALRRMDPENLKQLDESPLHELASDLPKPAHPAALAEVLALTRSFNAKLKLPEKRALEARLDALLTAGCR